jgi:hypothetical protein
MQGTRPPGTYRLSQFSTVELVEMCWQLWSFLEHGGYDLSDRQMQALLMKFARPLTHIAWQTVSRTQG